MTEATLGRPRLCYERAMVTDTFSEVRIHIEMQVRCKKSSEKPREHSSDVIIWIFSVSQRPM